MRLGDLDALCDEFKRRQRAALRWKEEAILADNEGSKIRADAVLSFLSEVKLTIDNAPTIIPKEFEPIVEKTVPAIVEKIERPTGELISREALKKAILDAYDEYDGYDPHDLMRFAERVDNEIDNAPTVDIKPFASVTFDKEELNKIVEERIIEPIKRGELVIRNEWIPITKRPITDDEWEELSD